MGRATGVCCLNCRVLRDGAGSAGAGDRFLDVGLGHPDVSGIDFHGDRMPSARNGGDRRRTGSGERIQDDVTRKGKHPNESFGQLDGIRRGVAGARGRPANVCPHRTPPALHFFSGEHRQGLLQCIGRSVMSALSEEQDVLNVVFHDGPGLIGLAVEPGAVALGFRDAVGNLVPQDGRERIELECAHPDLDIRVQRHDKVLSEPSPGHAHVADDATDAPARDQYPGAFLPRLVELVKECFVGFDRAELTIDLRVFLERPIGRRGDDQVNGSVRNLGQVAGVALSKRMGRLVKWRWPRYLAKSLVGRPQDFEPLGGVVGLRQRFAVPKQLDDVAFRLHPIASVEPNLALDLAGLHRTRRMTGILNAGVGAGACGERGSE